MHLFIRDPHGKVISFVHDVPGSPVGCSTITTVHGSFTIDEIAVDYREGCYNAYSKSYTIHKEWEGERNAFGNVISSTQY